ncbi:TATA-binding protein-associated factor 2N-like [Periplaneta americana]|uniref:TATA-binding protein-associated factor 2N-like n=1 Tax=Periplaneta americana TaxID=6978 RepID=UPI0037E73519
MLECSARINQSWLRLFKTTREDGGVQFAEEREPIEMAVTSTCVQAAGVFLLLCGYLQAVTITPLPYKGNEQGFRYPRGTATFLDQDEGLRIRREMMAGAGTPGFYGGNDYDRRNYEKRSYDGRRPYDDRYGGNEIDRDMYYEKGQRDYYPNYNPVGSRRDYDCDPRNGGDPYDRRGSQGFQGGDRGHNDWGQRGYNGGGRGGYDERPFRGNDRGRGGFRGHDDRNGGFQPGFRGDGQWGSNGGGGGGGGGGGRGAGGGRGYYDDNLGEGTVGFYGRSRRTRGTAYF